MSTATLRKSKKNSVKGEEKKVTKTKLKNSKKKPVAEKDVPAKNVKSDLIWLDGVSKKGIIALRNLDDLPRKQKSAVEFYDGKKANDKNKLNLAKAMKAVGLTFNPDKGYNPAELERNRKKESNLPKFEARVFDDLFDFEDGDNTWIELGHNYKPKKGTIYIALIETGKGKKKKIKPILLELTFIGVNCCHFANLENEDSMIGELEWLEERKIWLTDEDGDPVDDNEYELVPVKRPKAEKDDEDAEDYEDDDEEDEEDDDEEEL